MVVAYLLQSSTAIIYCSVTNLCSPSIVHSRTRTLDLSSRLISRKSQTSKDATETSESIQEAHGDGSHHLIFLKIDTDVTVRTQLRISPSLPSPHHSRLPGRCKRLQIRRPRRPHQNPPRYHQTHDHPMLYQNTIRHRQRSSWLHIPRQNIRTPSLRPRRDP